MPNETEPAQAPSVAPGQTEIPDWVTETPEEMTYFLEMENPSGNWLQEIPLSRAEYVTLKAHLARMRGLPPAAPETE